MTTFPINRAVKRHIGLALAQQFPNWTIADLTATNSTLTVIRPLTDTDVATINAIINRIEATLAEAEQQRRANINTFAWMNSKPAQQWKAMLSHRRN